MTMNRSMSVRTTNDEAAAWAVRLDGAGLSAEEQRDFEQWLEASPQHQGALLRAQAVWMSLDSPGAQSPTTADPVSPQAVPVGRETGRVRVRSGLGRKAWIAVAAGLATAVVGLAGHQAWLLRGDVYETSIGEVRRIALEDGSAVTLNSDSRATVRFEPGLRTVRLTRGEGLFEVAKDKARPFMVLTDQVSVRAVGTAFSVRAVADDVLVTVTEGVVDVTPRHDVAHRLGVNQRAEIHSQRPMRVTSESATETHRQLAWREGLVSFSGESLADAVREVNRYSRRQVQIADPALASMPVIGIFRAGDVDAFAQTTAAALGIEARTDGQVIRLVPANHP